MPVITRRRMLAMTALTLNAPRISALCSADDALSPAGEPAPATHIPDWIHHNRTLIAEGYNPPFYPTLDYTPSKAIEIAVDLDCDSMRYPAASYYAYFPTQSGYPVHPDLKGDPMRETLAALRKAGMHTIAYIPLNHPFMSVESKDPRYADWTRRSIDGTPITTGHYGWGRFFEGCLNSPVREVIRKLTAEVLSYDVDVMYFDGPYEGMENASQFCHCVYCRQA